MEIPKEFQPRNCCETFMRKDAQGKTPILLTKEEFDKHCKEGDFSGGPFRCNFGDDYGEPYNPYRQAYGILKTREAVYCELNPRENEKVKSLLEKLSLEN